MFISQTTTPDFWTFHYSLGRVHRIMKLLSFTGGIFDTNCYVWEAPGGTILVDAPQDSLDWLQSSGIKPDLLVLTHGHLDHVVDAAAIAREFGAKVAYHPDSIPMLTEPDFFRRHGFEWEIEPVAADQLLEEATEISLLEQPFQVLHVPGHCDGSICLLEPGSGILFGGDVLFAGGVGRWDLPGGDRDLLLQGIREKVLPLGDPVRVLPGHGPETTIGHERQTNPFLQW